MKFTRLSHQILAVFVVVVILTLGATGGIIIGLAQRIVADNVTRGNQELVLRLAEEIDLAVEDIRPVLQLLAESQALRTLTPAATEAELARYQTRFPIITRAYVAAASGEQIARSDGQPLENVSTNFGFQLARQGRELISDVYLPEPGAGPMLTVYQPIEEQGQVAGVLAADVNFARLQNVLSGLDLTRNETVVVLAANGRVVAHSRPGELARPLVLDDPTVVETLVGGPPGVLEGYTDELGREVVGVHAPARELGWGVIIQTPVGELASEVATLRRTMALGLSGGVALAVLAGWLMAGRLVKPIGRLVRATERVEAGDLDHAVEVSASNEVGILAAAFNRMVASLRASQDQTKQLVEEMKQLNVGLEQRVAAATEETARRADELATLFEIGKEITATLELDAILQMVVDRSRELMKADLGEIHLLDAPGGEESRLLFSGLPQGQCPVREKPTLRGLNGEVLRTGRPVRFADRQEFEGTVPLPANHPPIGPFLGAPIMSEGSPIADILLAREPGREAFTARDEKTLVTVANLAAMAIENARLYEAAQAADRLKSVFLATMSHELRTPLNSIIGFTGVMLQGLAGRLNDEQTKQLGMVRGSARHLLDLINDVLDISRIEAGQLEIASEPFDPRAAIEKVVQTVAPLAEKKGLALAAEVAPEVGPIRSDQRRVEQVLINLVNNAVKFTEQGRVSIQSSVISGQSLKDHYPNHAGRALVTDNWLLITVRDTGIGIKPEDLSRLFEPFRQIESGLTRRHEGTGLGLSICKRLVEMLGGEIWVESEWGVGSTFTFTLPVDL